MCGLCRIDTDGKSWCPPCFERMSAEGSLPGAARRFRNYARLAAACFVLSFFLPAAGLGLFYAIRGLRDKRARKEPDGLVELYVWVVLCSLFVLAWIGAILLIVLAMTGVFDS
jgi:hypothetical protein